MNAVLMQEKARASRYGARACSPPALPPNPPKDPLRRTQGDVVELFEYYNLPKPPWTTFEPAARSRGFESIIEEAEDLVPSRFALGFSSFWEEDLANWTDPKAIENTRTAAYNSAIASWCRGGQRTFFFQGSPDVGKTVLATATYYLLLKAARWEYPWDEAEKPQWLDCGEIEAPNTCKESRVLLLDDLGQEQRDPSVSASLAQGLSRLMRYRHNANLYTLVTTSLTDQDLAKIYGADVLRRLTAGHAVSWPDP